jgi:hypothetical protein
MDIWQFWLSIIIIFTLLGVIIAILVKKHKDRHRIANLHTNIKALETSFKTLQSEIEVVTERNLETMENKCERMSQLLEIADQKCIYAGDLINEIDKSTKLLKETKSLNDMPVIGNTFDEEKFKEVIDNKITSFMDDVKNKIDSLERGLNHLNDRLSSLENKSLEIADNSEILEIKKEIKELSSSISEKVTNEISMQLKDLDEDFSEIDDTEAISIDENNDDYLNKANSDKETELFPAKAIIESIGTTNSESPVKNTISIDDENDIFLPKGNDLVVKEIMEKYEQGYSIPQIASKLNMNRGEVALIIKVNKKTSDVNKVGNYGN